MASMPSAARGEEVPDVSGDSIDKRLRYALPIRGYSQTRFLPVFNEHLQRIAPHAKPITAGALSRICTGKRRVYDFEVLALVEALDLDLGWLMGRGALDPVRGRR